MSVKPRDIDEADLDLWLGLPSERKLRDLVSTLTAHHGLIATERRWHEDRRVVRARSLALGGGPDGADPVVLRAWQRHVDYDLWAEREWPVLPDDVLDPDAPSSGDPSAEARCWLHEQPLPECGCPVMGRAAAPTGYERLTGEPQASSPFEREAPAAVVVERWQSACPSCRAHFVASERPPHLCAECHKPTLGWRPGVDAEPLVAWAPLPAARAWRNPTDEETGPAHGPAEDASLVQPGSTVPPGPYTQAEGPQGGTGEGTSRGAPSPASPPAPNTAGAEAHPGHVPVGALACLRGSRGAESISSSAEATSQRAEGPQEAPSPLVSGAPSLAPDEKPFSTLMQAFEGVSFCFWDGLPPCQKCGSGHGDEKCTPQKDAARRAALAARTNQGEAPAPTGAKETEREGVDRGREVRSEAWREREEGGQPRVERHGGGLRAHEEVDGDRGDGPAAVRGGAEGAGRGSGEDRSAGDARDGAGGGVEEVRGGQGGLTVGAAPAGEPQAAGGARGLCMTCEGTWTDSHRIGSPRCDDCRGTGRWPALVQPTPAVVALVAQAAGNVEARTDAADPWTDPACGCERSPDVSRSTPCPTHAARSTPAAPKGKRHRWAQTGTAPGQDECMECGRSRSGKSEKVGACPGKRPAAAQAGGAS